MRPQSRFHSCFGPLHTFGECRFAQETRLAMDSFLSHKNQFVGRTTCAHHPHHWIFSPNIRMWDPPHFSTRHRGTQADNGQGGPRNSNPTRQPFGFGATGRQPEHQESNQLSWSMLPPKQQDSAFSSATVLDDPFHFKAPQSSFAYRAPAQSQQQTFSDYGPKPAMFGSCSTRPHLSTNTNTRANRMTTSPFSKDQHRNVFCLSSRTPFDGTSTTESLSSSSSSNPFSSNTRTGSTLPFVFGLPEHAKPTTDVTTSSSSGHKYVGGMNQPYNNTAPVFSSNNINSTDTTRMTETFGPWGAHGLVSKNNPATKTFSPMNSGYFHDGNQPTDITTNTTTTGMFPQTGCHDETNGGFPASKSSSSLSVLHQQPEQAQQQSTAWSGVDGWRTNPDHWNRSGFCGYQTTNNSCQTGECTSSFRYSSGRLGGWEPLPPTFVGKTTPFAEADTIVSSAPNSTRTSLFPTTTTMLGNNKETNNNAVDDSTIKSLWTSWRGPQSRAIPAPTTTNNTHEVGATTMPDSTTTTPVCWDWSTTAPPSAFVTTTTSSPASPSSSWSQKPGVGVATTTTTTPRPVTPVVVSSVLATPELPQQVNDRGIRALLQCKQEMEASPVGQSIHNNKGATTNRQSSCYSLLEPSSSSLVRTTRRIRPRGFS